MEMNLRQFENYVRRIYHGSSRSLKYSHLKKGALLQYSVKIILDDLRYDYVEESEVGSGADFVVGISPYLVPIECKNEKFHTESPKSVGIDIISRFKDYPKSSPKILLTSKVKYTPEARKLLNEYNIQIIAFPEDIKDFNELYKLLTEIFPLIARSLYKFNHYKKYKQPQKSSENKKWVDISSNNILLSLPHYHPYLSPTTTSIHYYPPPIINYLVSYVISYMIYLVYTRSSFLHILISSYPHILISSYPHILISSYPHILISSYPPWILL